MSGTTTASPVAGTARLVVEDVDEPRFQVATHAYSSPEIFEKEMRTIFEKGWVYLCHESQIGNAGDYISTFIGRQSVIVSRDKSGGVNVMINACRHRGNAVCRVERGNASFFQCPYHGWIYGLDGRLAGITDRTRFPEGLQEKIGGLVKAAAVGQYRGLVFATLSAEAGPFEDYIEPVRTYIDDWADKSPTVEYQVTQAHRFSFPGNWKFQAENSLDGYHGRFTHESGFKALAYTGEEGDESQKREFLAFDADTGLTRGIPGGHSSLESRRGWSAKQIGAAKVGAAAFDSYVASLTAAYGETRAHELLNSRHLFIYPNLVLMDLNLRAIIPVAADKTLVDSFFVSCPAVDPIVNRARQNDLEARLGSTGFVGLDDLEMFAANQTGVLADGLPYIELSRGLHLEQRNELGETVGAASDETPMRAFWRQWGSQIDTATEECGR
jgi:phenylpropionate dioxygenase-like ring-hydroxylating dioxygenase large terminal subunit